MWTIAAPAARHSTAACAISSSLVGTAGFCSFVTQEPVVATEMMSLSVISHLLLLQSLWAPRCPRENAPPDANRHGDRDEQEILRFAQNDGLGSAAASSF